ncbi:hypothetical protein NQZ68_007618 [Dissostichus eleginoides]|nr:hypothetical protein NQZ68_007618 [Dissostichus eleginoides]
MCLFAQQRVSEPERVVLLQRRENATAATLINTLKDRGFTTTCPQKQIKCPPRNIPPPVRFPRHPRSVASIFLLLTASSIPLGFRDKEGNRCLPLFLGSLLFLAKAAHNYPGNV